MTELDSFVDILNEPGRAGPAYQRIADAISDRVKDGRLLAGRRLPTHRELARHVGVSVPTVTRAYRTVEQRGLIDSIVGKGTFVGGIPNLREDPPGDRTRLDLAVNGPARGEHARLLSATLEAIAEDEHELASLLSYASDIGSRVDRDAAREWMRRSGLEVRSEQIAICSGGQHAILVALNAALRRGDVLLTEALTFPGVKSAARLVGARVVGVAMDEHGLIPEALEAACEDGTAPTALYLMPTAHNPTTATLPADRREAIADIARRHDLLLIEDDIFSLLVGDAFRPEPLAMLAPERTLHLTSLSKTLTPGLRWGALASPEHLADRMGAVIRASIFSPVPLTVRIARTWLTDGTAERLLDWQRTEMDARFTLAKRTIAASDHVRTVRTGGLHAWVELAAPWTTDELIDQADVAGVQISPTSFFAAGDGARPDGFRLCLGNASSRPRLADGLSRLAALLDRGPTWAAGTRV